MTTFRRFVSAFSLFLILGAAACSSSISGVEDCGTSDVACLGGGGTITHGSDN